MPDGRLPEQVSFEEIKVTEIWPDGPTLCEIWREIQEVKEFLRHFEEFFLQEFFGE